MNKTVYFSPPAGSAPPKKRLPRACAVIYLLALASTGLYIAFTQSQTLSDWFNQTVSTWGRRLLAYATAWIPISLAELLLLLIPLIAAALIFIAYRHFSASGHDAWVYVRILLSAPAAVWIIFVWNFAPGYYGTTLDQKLDLDRQKVSAEELYGTAELLSAELKALEAQIDFGEDGFSRMPYSYEEMNQKLLETYESFCEDHKFIDHFYSRCKPVMLSEPMSYTHITGVYTFFTGEANINVNFPDYTVPYTAAHELAHQRGIAREDEANFIAFLVCMESEDPYIRYSACLNLYEYVCSALREADKELYKKSYLNLPKTVQEEELAYSRFFEKYRKSLAADVSKKTNDVYLQSQGAAEGTKSYNLVVDLAVAYYKPLLQ